MIIRRLVPVLLISALITTPVISAKDKDEKFLAPGVIHLDRDGEKWAQKTLKKMSLEDKVGQMFMIWAKVSFTNLDSPQYKDLRDTMRKFHLGGFGVTVPVETGLLIRNEPYETAMLLNQLQRDSDLPLIMAADFERGLSMRLYGGTVFPHSMAFGAAVKPEYAEAFGRITGEEARAIGVHWNWFPDADVNSNPVNPVINTRAFGADPKQVGELVAAYIKGAHEAGMMTCAKHFPGHGDTATDSHLGLASVTGEQQRLDSIELPPFQKAIEAGVDSVMVAHVTVPALEPDPNVVASTSHRIITDLLKGKMRFNGLVVTDALDMNGLMRIYANTPNPSGAAAAAAVKAGNDMVLIPGDLPGAINGILNAVKSGEIPQSQIDASVLKILRAKASLGLHKARLVDPSRVGYTVGKTENVATGQQIADAAVTQVRNNGLVLPLAKTQPGTNPNANAYTQMQTAANRVLVVLFTDDLRSEEGRKFVIAFRQRRPDATIMLVDPNVADGMAGQVLEAVKLAQEVILPVYAAPRPGRAVRNAAGEITNSAGMPESSGALMHRVLETAAPKSVMLAMGNPYLASDFPEVQNYITTYSFATVSELSAVKALFGEIPITGKLPVTIPGITGGESSNAATH